MTPAEIAAQMTPAQVRALRDPNGCTIADWDKLQRCYGHLTVFNNFWFHTRDGHAVLAELERIGK